MLSFLASFGDWARDPRKAESVMHALAACLPKDCESTTYQTGSVLGGKGSWAKSCPSFRCSTLGRVNSGLISVFETEDGWCLAFGDIHEPTPKSCAELVLETFNDAKRQSRSAAQAVFELNGNFGAVVVELAPQRVWLLHDLMGRRRLRYRVTPHSLAISTSDAALALLTDDPGEWNPVAAACTTTIDWPIGGESLLKNVRRAPQLEAVAVDIGRSPFAQKPVRLQHPLSMARVARNDSKALQELRENCIEAMCSLIASHTAEGTLPLSVSLTAGLDSRAALAVTRHVASASAISTWTSGLEHDTETRIARILSERCGLPHQATTPASSARDFFKQLRRRAFYYNGLTNAKRCFVPFAPYERRAIAVGGGFAETLRGFYYWGTRQTQGGVPWALSRMTQKLSRKKLGLVPAEIETEVQGRVAAAAQSFAQLGQSGYDTLDAFYVHERLAHWSLNSQVPETEWRADPFGASRLAQLAFRFPSPIGKNTHLHRQLIHRWLPEARWLPVNGSYIPPLIGYRPAPRLLAVTGRIKKELRRRLPSLAQPSAVPAAQGIAFKKLLRDHPGLLTHGVLEHLFERQALLTLQRQHILDAGHAQAIGFLLTMVEFEQLLADARAHMQSSASQTQSPAAPRISG